MKSEKVRNISYWFLFIIGLVIYTRLAILFISNNLLPIKMRLMALLIGLAIYVLLGLALLNLNRYPKTQLGLAMFMLAIIVLLSVGHWYIAKAVNTINEMNQESERREAGSAIASEKDNLDYLEANISSDGSFNILISGIDTDGSLNNISRSDVNVILTVNPDKKQILMTSLPRDTYMPIARGGQEQMDKLTHSGLYGIGSTVESVENFLSIDINYYVRVNFRSLITIVNALGGIHVDNPQEFSTSSGKYFAKGNIYLNGEDALTFSRERKNLSSGDVGRGQNQMRVIEGMIKKALTPSILLNYGNIMNIASKSLQTNMPTAAIIDLVNHQIENNTAWQMSNMTLDGEHSMSHPSFAIPNQQLYMYIPNQESINHINSRISTVLAN